MSLAKRFYGPVLVERAAFTVLSEYSTANAKEEWSTAAMDYMSSIQCFESPYLNTFLKVLHKNPLAVDKSLFSETSKKNAETTIASKTVAHEYADALTLQELDDKTPFLCKLCKIVQILILSEKWKSIDELDHRLQAYVKPQHRNVPDFEGSSYLKLKLLICGALYLQGKYFDCLKYFLLTLQEDRCFVDQLLQPEENAFFTNDEILTMVSLSALISIPLDNYDEFAQLEDLKSFFAASPLLSDCLSLLINTSYNRFLKVWHGSLHEKCSSNFFLNKRWQEVQETMRHKIYFFYLRVSNKVELTYLSDTLGIDLMIVQEEVCNMIETLGLNFERDGLVIYHRNKYETADLLSRLSTSSGILTTKIEKLKIKNDNLRAKVQQSIIQNNAALLETKSKYEPDTSN